MTHSNRITLRIFLTTSQLKKIVDCWVNLNGERAWGLQRWRQCQKTSVWVSKWAMVARSEGRHERAITTEWTRISVHEDRCQRGLLSARIAEGTTVAAASVGMREDTERVRIPTRCHTWKRVGKTVGPCVAVLCVDMDTVHGCCKTTGLPLFCSKEVCCTRSAEWSQEVKKAKTYRMEQSQSFIQCI